MLVANDNGVAQFYHASKNVSSNIGTAGVIAEVFGEQFIMPVWSGEARFDRDLRNGECLPTESLRLSTVKRAVLEVTAEIRHYRSDRWRVCPHIRPFQRFLSGAGGGGPKRGGAEEMVIRGGGAVAEFFPQSITPGRV